MSVGGVDGRSGASRFGAFLLLLILSFCSLAYVVKPVSVLFSYFSVDYNEGWNAYHTWRLLHHQVLYPPVQDLIFNNYPPLSFYLIAGISSLGADPIFAGRVVSMFALLAVLAMLTVVTRRLGASWLLSLIGGLTVLAVIAGQYQTFVAFDDPQMLAHVFMMLALLCLTKQPLSAGTVIAASLLMLIGGFTKHSLIALPLATTLWLFSRDRALFRVWLITGLVGLATALGLCWIFFGPGFFVSVFGHKREITVGLFARGLTNFMPVFFVSLLGSLPLLFRAPRRGLHGLMALATVIATVWALVMWSGRGVGWDANFDAVFFGVPSAVSFLDSLLTELPPSHLARTVVGVLWVSLAIPAVSPLPYRGPQLVYWIRDRHAQIRATERAIAYIRNTPGTAVCFRLALCYWAGKPFAIDVFNTTQASLKSPEVKRALIQAFDQLEFAAIQIPKGFRANSSPFGHAITRSYEPTVSVAPYGDIWTPKSPNQ